jgi:small GTP-binding protein
MPSANLTIALVGNPNCGKTTLFNALTGARQTVGNWPGVTVERKSGYYRFQGQEVEVVDLPGVYAMDAIPGATTLDQQVTHDFVLSDGADLIVNILDGSNLERNLYLTTQLLELGRPMVVALNMVDAAAKKGHGLDAAALARLLDCPVVPMSASTGQGVEDLKALLAKGRPAHPQVRMNYPPPIEVAVARLAGELDGQRPGAPCPDWTALKLLEGDTAAPSFAGPHTLEEASALRRQIEADYQLATFGQHPLQSTSWILGILLTLGKPPIERGFLCSDVRLVVDLELDVLKMLQGLFNNAVVRHPLDGGHPVAAVSVWQMDIDLEIGQKGGLLVLLEGGLDPQVPGIDPLLFTIACNEGRDTGPQGDHKKVRRRRGPPLATHGRRNVSGDALSAHLGREQHVPFIAGYGSRHFLLPFSL